jgi:hypothetical protein
MSALALLIGVGQLTLPVSVGATPWQHLPSERRQPPSNGIFRHRIFGARYLKNEASVQHYMAAPHLHAVTPGQHSSMDVLPFKFPKRQPAGLITVERLSERFISSDKPAARALEVCPGADANYRCNHHASSSVTTLCVVLLDTKGEPLHWHDKGNFWDITNQKAWMWDDDIRRNGGDSSCIDMWSTAKLVQNVGCENVQIRCDSTDLRYVTARMKIWRDGTQRVAAMMEAAHEPAAQAAEVLQCLKKKCYSNPVPSSVLAFKPQNALAPFKSQKAFVSFPSLPFLSSLRFSLRHSGS